jgi:formate C-acetyltransferase
MHRDATLVASPFAPLSERTRRSREASLRRLAAPPPSRRAPTFDAAFFGTYATRPYWERYARSVAAALRNEPVYLFDDELLVGLLYQTSGAPPGYTANSARWAEFCPWQQTQRRIAGLNDRYLVEGGAPGHIGWRWDRVLAHGVEGLMAELRRRLAATEDKEARRLYRAALLLWRAVLAWNTLHVKALRAKRHSAEGSEASRLDRLIEICSRVPRWPARTFHEAVQSFHLQHLALMFENPYGGNGPGRLDYFLWPYLERDLAAGVICRDEAKELIDELFLRFHERLGPADGWVEALSVGGVHPDGRDAVNPLSHMMTHAIGALPLTHPSVYHRLGPEAPRDFVALVSEYLVHGQNRAQVYNDEACVRAIAASGVPLADARMYMAGGCMEISVQGAACDQNFSRTHNVAKTLELVLSGGVDLVTGARILDLERALPDYADFEALYAAFEQQLAYEYRQMVRGLDIQSEMFARYRPAFLLSSLVDDCLARGREQQAGGARYHDYGFAPLAITSAAGSLNGIRVAVFEEGFVSGAELLAALKADFAGHEALRLRLTRIPAYGVQDAAADALCSRVLASVCNTATRQRTRFGGQLKPMVFNFVWTPGASAALGARGDGSHAGERIGHGLTPASRAMSQGLTAAIGSLSSLDLSVVSGGATTMWDMDPQWLNPARMQAILETFMGGGGMIFQGNTTDVAQMEDAMQRPEQHPDLIVRVGGYSARFTTLSPDLQREIVSRRRHGRE